ncbi:hypothetical protein TNCV_2671671 [Trichonephila clavipes]|nr:hypothetical protein TNCV_2671671 [Trichonephila clavipes]
MPPTSLSRPPTSRKDLQIDGYLQHYYAEKTLYIYKHPRLLRDSKPSPTAQQSTSLPISPMDCELKLLITLNKTKLVLGGNLTR